MSDELVEQITKDIPLTWITGRVLRITTPTVTLSYLGGEIPHVAVSDQYTPVIGDVVQCLSDAKKGILVLCSTNTTGPPSVALPASVTGTAVTGPSGSYSFATGTWSSDPSAGPGRLMVWFVGGGEFEPYKRIEIGRFEAQVIPMSGGPLEFSLVLSNGMTEPLQTDPAALYLVAAPVGVATWVPLPLEWARKLLSNEAYGIAVGNGQYSAEFMPGPIQLRFTSI